MSEIQEIHEAVHALNQAAYEATRDDEINLFRYDSNGDAINIYYCGERIWDTESDEREWISDGKHDHEQESIRSFLERESRKFRAKLRRI